MNNRPITFGMGRLALFGVGLSVVAVHASIDSGGGKGSVGPLISHSSLGAPFASSSVTAGGIDLLYPLQNGQPTPPPEKPSGGAFGGGGGGGPAPATKKGKSGAGISKQNNSSNKKSSANKAQNKKSISATNKKSTSQSKKKTKKK